MKSRCLALAVVAACSSKAEHVDPEPPPEPVVRVPDPMAPLFERVLPGEETAAPLLGPGDSLAVASRRWTRDGRYLGRHAWASYGQVRPIAIIGSPTAPAIVAIAWGGMENLADGPPRQEREQSWLLVAAPDAKKPSVMVPVDSELSDATFTVSPSRDAIAGPEGGEIVVRALPSLAVIAKAPFEKRDDAPVACWVDGARVAWTESAPADARLRTLTVATRAVVTSPLAAAAPLVCDPGGSAAAMLLPDRVAVIDLATAATLASLPVAPAVGTPAEVDLPDRRATLAVGQHGARLAIATGGTLAIYHREGQTLESLYRHPLAAEPRMQFSLDGARLAVAAQSLVVFGAPADAHRTIAPRLSFELPPGFAPRPPVAVGEHTAWEWSQLAAPASLTPGTALLVDAVDETRFADVTAIALPPDELPGAPAPDATDEQIAAFARSAMPQLFEQWTHAEIGTTDDDTFTLRVGRTKGLPWFETREQWRDGCEPYDGYTRVVIDRDAVFVVRALVPPGGAIKGWLEKFLDLPFGNRVQTARRRGHSSGPC